MDTVSKNLSFTLSPPPTHPHDRELDTLSSRLSSLQSFLTSTTDELTSLQATKTALEAHKDKLTSSLALMEGKGNEVQEEARCLRDRVSQLEVGREGGRKGMSNSFFR